MCTGRCYVDGGVDFCWVMFPVLNPCHGDWLFQRMVACARVVGCMVSLGCSFGWLVPVPRLWVFFVILGCLCPGFGQGLVFVSLFPGVWARVSLVGFPVGPECGVCFDVDGFYGVVVAFPSFLGGVGGGKVLFRADAPFLVFRGGVVHFSRFLGAFGFLYCHWLFVGLCPFWK